MRHDTNPLLLSTFMPKQTLAKELIAKVDGNDLKMRFAQEAAFYEHRLRTGQKAIFHLEAFVAKIMSVYKRHQMSMDL